jgi:hypothetical protein
MFAKVSVLALVAFGAAQATTYTFTNVFPQDGHVIGDQLKFAIQSVVLDIQATTVKVTVKENYDNADLDPFTITSQKGQQYTVGLGDFFFTNTAGTPLFGVAIKGHGGTVNGVNTGNTVLNTNLYKINNSSGVLQSQDVINKVAGDNLSFNSGVNVWLKDNGAGSISAEAGTSVTPQSLPVTATGNGTTTALYSLSFTINRASSSADAFNQLINGAFGFQVESADCANDYFSGTVVPEPATFSFIALGLAACSLKSRSVRSACRRLLHLR